MGVLTSSLFRPFLPVLQLAEVQEWRWALFHAVHADTASADPAALGAHLESLVFIWLRLRATAAALLASIAAAAGGQDWAEGAKLAAVGAQMDAALGLSAGPPAKPLLWKRGGRPLLPRTAELVAGQEALLALCEATRCGAGGDGGLHWAMPRSLHTAASLASHCCREACRWEGEGMERAAPWASYLP